MSRRLIALMLIASVLWAQDAPAKKDKAEPAKAEPTARLELIKVKLSGEEDPFPSMPFGKKQLNYYAFLSYIDEVARDPDVDAVELKLEGVGVGWARLLEVRDALKGLRRAGKKVFVYKENFSTQDMILASVADRISIPEVGMVVMPGLAIESWYMKGMLAKLRVKMDVIHIGEYKSAGESFVRDEMSKELRETLDPILDEFYASMVKAIAEGRGLSEDAVKKAIDKGLMTAREAKAAGLVDRVEYYDQFKDGARAYFPNKKLRKAPDRFKKKGPQLDPSNPFAMISTIMSAIMAPKEKLPEGDKIAVIYCSGAIVSGKSQYDWMGNIAAMGSETIVKAIDKARTNKDVKAIVMRINSPGGSALASDIIWRAVERAKEKKPVIASMGDVAASGGYYIAMNSNLILAEPQTITGSIGVVGMIPNVDDVYPWVGISPQRLTRGKNAASLLTTKGLDESGRAMIREMMQSIYTDFVAKVAAGRGKTPADIEPIARGRVWTGRAALANGLVDQLGGLDDALAIALKKGGVAGKRGADWHLLEYPKRKGPLEFLDDLFSMKATPGIEAAILAKVPELRRVLEHLQTMRAVARDKICVINPELTGFTQPAGLSIR